ncbi:hypothetical protein ACHQM5_012914 [Ranunculus cassubicifolius]
MNILYFISSCLILMCFSSPFAQAYTNYIVGDSLGWYDNLLKPTVNYQKWVVGKNFSLGDFLFVHTYNITTYKRCDFDNAQADDTTQWATGQPSSTAPDPITVEVPLIKQGMIYFFSSEYEGEQCKHGQHFNINVKHGLGLPDSLKTPSADAPAPYMDEDSTPDPDTPVSSNFNNPKESSPTTS